MKRMLRAPWKPESCRNRGSLRMLVVAAAKRVDVDAIEESE